MRSQIRELRFLVVLLEGDLLQQAIDGKDEPAQWSSAALMLREVANRSLQLRRQALALAAEALGLDRQTLGTLRLFEESLPPEEAH